jgi:hypothetical protein
VTETLPTLAWTRVGERADFDVPLSSRSLNAVAFELDPEGPAVSASVVWHMKDGDRTVDLGLVDPKFGKLLAFAPDDFAWVRSGWVLGVAVRGPKVVGRPEPLHHVAQVGLLAPKENERRPPTSPPAIEFRPVRPMDHYRVTFDFVLAAGIHLPVIYDVPASRFESFGEGFLRWTPRPGRRGFLAEGGVPVSWETLPTAFERELVARGVYRVRVSVRVEGMARSGVPRRGGRSGAARRRNEAAPTSGMVSIPKPFTWGRSPDPSTGAVVVPIYQTSTYAQEDAGVHKGHEYTRTSNRRADALQQCLAALEGGNFGLAFGSGLGPSPPCSRCSLRAIT